jgi:CP family cyanate transporter-like MFS transporter
MARVDPTTLPDGGTATEPAAGPAVDAAPVIGRRAAGWLVAAGVLLVAVNLRPAVTSVGALLDEVQAGLRLSGAMAGVLTTLPALCFGTFSAVTPWLSRRYGAHRVLVGAMVALVAGLALRPLSGSALPFVAASVLALAGIAVGNVTLPVLVRAHFPHRLGLVTGLYTTVLNAGTAIASAVTVPAAHLTGGWRGGLAVWAAVAVLGLLPWLGSLRHDPTRGAGAARATRVRPARTRLGWAVAVFMGTQSLQAYVAFGWLAKIFTDAGYSPTAAGLLLSLVTAVGMPIAFVLPGLASRGRDQRPYVVVLVVAYLLGYVGLLVAPHAGAIAWAVLIGVGGGAFPLALLMMGLRSASPAGTAALSGFAQSVGYLLAASGPLLVGVLHQLTGGWLVPILLLLALLVPQLLAGLAAARDRRVEDEQPTGRPAQPQS